jgi:SulP family sulfate permease
MKWLPPWLTGYRREWLAGDLTAGLIVTVMLIPQSLAYAMLAGLPPQIGLYASIVPILAYAALGTSMTLAVGPVAVISLMSASALAPLAAPGSDQFIALSVQLALLSGLMLLAFGALRLGFLANFLSHPVISGFISGSAILIAVGQLRHLLGVKAAGDGIPGLLASLVAALPQTNGVTLSIGLLSLLFLWAARRWLAGALSAIGMPRKISDLFARLAPMLAVIVSTLTVWLLQLDERAGVAVVGAVPSGLPVLRWPGFDVSMLSALLLPALLLSLVGFVESVSVAQSLALKRRERIVPNRELLGLGAANVASALSGAYPVTGGFARSVVNFAAGAVTPLAGVISALLMALVVMGLTGLFYYLPHAVLAATIIIAVTSLIDVQTLKEAWAYDRADALALIATALGVLLLGVEAGILLGVGLSLGVLVWRSSRPHVAVVGRIPGTEHFRNVQRHQVQTVQGLLAVRIDENLFFGNAAMVESALEAHLAADPSIRRLVLSFAGVNQVDSTALGVLTQLEQTLAERGIRLDLAEVKGPVMDRLRHTDLGVHLKDRIHLSLHEAFISAGEGATVPSEAAKPRN